MPATSSSAFVRLRGRRLVGPLALRCSDTTRWSRARVQATYSRRIRSWKLHLLVDRQPRSSYSSVLTFLAEPVSRPRPDGGGNTTRRRRPRPMGAVDMPETIVIGELQSLGAVDRHDPHGVIVGLGQDGLGHPGPLGRLAVDPVQVLAQVAAGGLAPRPGLVDDEAQPPPDVAGPALGEPELEGPPVAGDPVEQLRRRQPVALVVQRAQVGQADRARGRRAGTVSGWSAR